MMRHITKIAFLLFILSSSQLFGQGKIVFEKTEHEFGNIKEEGGPAAVTFEFTNTGNAPIKLTNVKASCGCTTPQWTQEAVQPGKTGIVKASYNPSNRPGKFNKSITVNTDGEPSVVFLKIKGNVIPRKRGVNDWYPNEMGNLRMKSRTVYFRKVLHDQIAEEKFVLYNQGDKPINLYLNKSFAPLAYFLEVNASNKTIGSKDSVTLRFKYNAKNRNDWGYVSDLMTLHTDDELEPQKRIYVSAKISENFGNITSDTKLPMIKFDKVKHNFGKINQNTRNSTAFTLTNEGQAPLYIRKTKASCGCTASQPKKKVLQPGESTSIDVTYSSGTKKGPQRQSVTVITNDPANAETVITIEAEVNDPSTPSGNK